MQQETDFQEYRSLLFSIAYHMLGSVMDAEDCVQETFLQWYARDPEKTVQHPKAFLSTLVTRRCIDSLRSARSRREAYVGLWLPEPLVDGDPSERSEMNESLSTAFLFLLERLSPIERAVFLLRQVFDYDYAEIAAIVEKSEENCRQVMHRARRHLSLPRSPAQGSQEQRQRLFSQFWRAYQEGDMDGLLQVLAEEVVVHTDGGGKVGAARNPIYGSEHVARYLLGLQRKVFRLIKVIVQPRLINGQPGLIGYFQRNTLPSELLLSLNQAASTRSGVEGKKTIKQLIEVYQPFMKRGKPAFVLALTFAETHIQEIDLIVNPEKLRHIPACSLTKENGEERFLLM